MAEAEAEVAEREREGERERKICTIFFFRFGSGGERITDQVWGLALPVHVTAVFYVYVLQLLRFYMEKRFVCKAPRYDTKSPLLKN